LVAFYGIQFGNGSGLFLLVWGCTGLLSRKNLQTTRHHRHASGEQEWPVTHHVWATRWL